MVLYCKFSHPHKGYKGSISIIWGDTKERTIFFKYTNYLSNSKYKNEILSNAEGRYKPMGDPRKNDASIIINRLGEKDTTKNIYCRVELEVVGAKFQCLHGPIKLSGEELLFCKHTFCLSSSLQPVIPVSLTWRPSVQAAELLGTSLEGHAVIMAGGEQET